MTKVQIMEKLNCIMLIDDDEPTNFFNEFIIGETDCTKRILVFDEAQKALSYLKEIHKDPNKIPELIFLDINMPGMDGWEFLKDYHQLDVDQKDQSTVVMLTTSLNPDDKTRSLQYEDVKKFLKKPLTIDKVSEIIKTFFEQKDDAA